MDDIVVVPPEKGTEQGMQKEVKKQSFPIALFAGIIIFILLGTIVAAYAGIIYIPGITPPKTQPPPPLPPDDDNERPPPLPDAVS